MIAFWQTPMGKTFFERTLPELVLAIKALAAVLGRLLELLEPRRDIESSS